MLCYTLKSKFVLFLIFYTLPGLFTEPEKYSQFMNFFNSSIKVLTSLNSRYTEAKRT